ncbi:hypothetical protein OO013_16385 [Mangrovivirga sp. M17]|uniref:Cxxc_20_cxxc protein n=1 Tax=Mangrovivirga halotolerans TaxID=2993936 RepID=A0ABT3RUK7_9BACT|nr:hypothetical protein [Mangrovivirga halotolerans]MCX2745459.1 hypothetical protein [Mangrovivirga halotolerans]
MKLIIKCKDCRNEIDSPYKASTRINIVQKFGEEFEIKCPACNSTNTYEVDDIRAVDYSFGELVQNRIAVFLVIMAVTFVLGFFLIGTGVGIITSIVSALIAIILFKNNNSGKNLTFNKHKVKGRMSNVGA